MKLLANSILVFSAGWLCLSLYGLFWPSTSARVIDNSTFSLTQNGYGSASRSGISNFAGATTNISLIRYRYSVADKIYYSTGIARSTGSHYIKIYYCPLFPAISLTNNSIPLPWLILLCILTFCIIEIRKWLANLIKKASSNLQ